MSRQPEITRHYLGGVQVCVPLAWTDEQVVEFARKGLLDEIKRLKAAPGMGPGSRLIKFLEACSDPKYWRIAESSDMHGDPRAQYCSDDADFKHMGVINDTPPLAETSRIFSEEP